MTKEEIINRISQKLNELKINHQVNEGTDISINLELLSAGWLTGNKKITYESSIYLDEKTKTVHMWELTKDVEQGHSFGFKSETTFQRGKTLFRKVKSIQYGPDGKAYEYSFNLGAIPQSVKDCLINSGWKFKTVLNKKEASWPVGYQPLQKSLFCSNCGREINSNIAFCPSCGTPNRGAIMEQHIPNQSTQPGNSQFKDINSFSAGNESQVKGKKVRRGGFLGFLGLLLMGLIAVLFLSSGKAPIAGWIASAVVLLTALFYQRKFSKKGCFVNLLIWIATGLALIYIFSYFNIQEITFTTATIRNPQMTSAIDAEGKPVDIVNSYTTTTKELIAVAELRNAPANTKIKFVWIYTTNNYKITEFTLDTKDRGSNIYIFSTLTNKGNPWPEGDYKVEMYLENREKPSGVVNFKVTNR